MLSGNDDIVKLPRGKDEHHIYFTINMAVLLTRKLFDCGMWKFYHYFSYYYYYYYLFHYYHKHHLISAIDLLGVFTLPFIEIIDLCLSAS